MLVNKDNVPKASLRCEVVKAQLGTNIEDMEVKIIALPIHDLLAMNAVDVIAAVSGATPDEGSNESVDVDLDRDRMKSINEKMYILLSMAVVDENDEPIWPDPVLWRTHSANGHAKECEQLFTVAMRINGESLNGGTAAKN